MLRRRQPSTPAPSRSFLENAAFGDAARAAGTQVRHVTDRLAESPRDGLARAVDDVPPPRHGGWSACYHADSTLRTTNTIERLHEKFRRRVKTQGSLPSEDAALVLLFILVASGQIKLSRIDG